MSAAAHPLPHVQPTLRMWQILRRCYRGENQVSVLERALLMLAGADGHLDAAGQVKTGRQTAHEQQAGRRP
ncbi:hypothetical protein OOK29_09575 [Streptomyces phaeochromogenes]|uniref:hypothetical protein n=1 Tax=Streptomyces phaeochromogenes TaxID=1923 RepID=UPI00224FDA85|nr:hypothetical protein [Streptomyces phaeochromogenes]MCX5598386.1 hypothetical protein [Streptomyces phaeochromogenes]